LQSSADPADIAPAAAGDLVLRQPQALHQFADRNASSIAAKERL
jgi:hypothetical protein